MDIYMSLEFEYVNFIWYHCIGDWAKYPHC